MRIAVIGAGLAGLTAARTASQAGADVVVFERAPEVGGTTRLSSGWLWAYHDAKTFRWAAPGGDRQLQRALVEGFDEDVRWLVEQGIEILRPDTENPRTRGVQVNAARTVEALAEGLAVRGGTRIIRAERQPDGSLWLQADDGGEATCDALVLAGGGYVAASSTLADRMGVAPGAPQHWVRRHAGGSDGSSQLLAQDLGASWAGSPGEVYARAMPAPDLSPDTWAGLSQVYGSVVCALTGEGRLVRSPAHDWADVQTTLAIARFGWGWYVVADGQQSLPTPYGPISECVGRAERVGAVVWRARGEEGLEAFLRRHGTSASEAIPGSPWAAIRVYPGLTHTMDGLRCDAAARVLDAAGEPVSGVFAAGVEVGGIATGGYGSGLAQALHLGRRAGAAAATG